jgi:3-oxoadipate enol-lactonase
MPDEIVPLRSGHLAVGDQKIWWEYHGTGDREVVALLNGLAMHTKAWYGFLPLLSDAWDVILYDYQGQGQSSKDDIPYFIPDFARHLSMIMDENDVEKAHVMGISYGGFIGLEFARLFQERTRTLCLSGILASHETLFSMYQAISLRFYRGTRDEFELYTHYMY